MSTKLGVLQSACSSCIATSIDGLLCAQFVLDAVRKSVRFIILAQIEETRLFTGVTHTCLRSRVISAL